MGVMLELASKDEKEAQDAYLDPARELLEKREQLGHIIES